MLNILKLLVGCFYFEDNRVVLQRANIQIPPTIFFFDIDLASCFMIKAEVIDIWVCSSDTPEFHYFCLSVDWKA